MKNFFFLNIISNKSTERLQCTNIALRKISSLNKLTNYKKKERVQWDKNSTILEKRMQVTHKK